MTVEDYTIEQFKEEFEDSSTLQGKHDAILKATGYCVEFAPDVDPEFLGVVKEYKQHLIDIKKEFVKEEMKRLQGNDNYYGSKEQIEAEKTILKESKIKMEWNECLEEYYYRILQS